MAASEQTYGRFRTNMPKTWLKNQNGVSNYRMAYQIIVACSRDILDQRAELYASAQRDHAAQAMQASAATVPFRCAVASLLIGTRVEHGI